MNSYVSVDEASSECCTEDFSYDGNISGSCSGDEAQSAYFSDFDQHLNLSDAGVDLTEEDLALLLPNVGRKTVLSDNIFTIVSEPIVCSEIEEGYNLSMYLSNSDSDEHTGFMGFSDSSGEEFLGFESDCKTMKENKKKKKTKRVSSVSKTSNQCKQETKSVIKLGMPSMSEDSRASADTLVTKKKSGLPSSSRKRSAKTLACQQSSSSSDEDISYMPASKQRKVTGDSVSESHSKTEAIDKDDYIGPFCHAVRCTISWLETGKAMIKPVRVNNGMVFEFDKFAKEIRWEFDYVIRWILRLRGYVRIDPIEEDLKKAHMVLKRRKAMTITFAGKMSLKNRLLNFDSEKFSFPTLEKLEKEKLRKGSAEVHNSPTERDSSDECESDKYNGIVSESGLGSKNGLFQFPLGNNYIGDHCRGNKIDISLLNKGSSALPGTITNGVVYELYHFFIDHGQTLTSLAHTLFRLKGMAIEDSAVASVLTNLHNLAKRLTEEGIQKNPDFPYEEFDASKPQKPLSTGSNFRPLPYEPQKASTVLQRKDETISEVVSHIPKRKVGRPRKSVNTQMQASSNSSLNDSQSYNLDKELGTVTPSPAKDSVVTVDIPKNEPEKLVEQDETKVKHFKVNDGKFDLNSTRGQYGQITRGDIVFLYTRWLRKKMESGSDVFVSDLATDVELLQKERAVANVHVPVGTLMSSSVRLFDQFRQLTRINMEDAHSYLLEDWMEDVRYLLKPDKSTRSLDSPRAEPTPDSSSSGKKSPSSDTIDESSVNSAATPKVEESMKIVSSNGEDVGVGKDKFSTKEVDKILDHKIIAGDVGPVIKYIIQYKGESKPCNEWINEEDIPSSLLKSFWTDYENKEQSSDDNTAVEESTKSSKLNSPVQIMKSFKEHYIDSLDPAMVNYQLDTNRDTSRRIKVTRKEVIDIYNEWRQGNVQRQQEGSRKRIDIEMLQTKVKALMEEKRVRNFNTNCLMDTCYRISLMCQKLENKDEVKAYLEGDYMEMMDASTKHLNCLKEENRLRTSARKSLDLKEKAKEKEILFVEEVEKLEKLQQEVEVFAAVKSNLKENTEQLTEEIIDNMLGINKSKQNVNTLPLSSFGISRQCIGDIVQIASQQ